MALLLQCFCCTKPSYADMDYDYNQSYTFVSSHQDRYFHRPRSRLDTIEEDIYEDGHEGMDDGQSLVEHDCTDTSAQCM